jgi:hypothetical protein
MKVKKKTCLVIEFFRREPSKNDSPFCFHLKVWATIQTHHESRFFSNVLNKVKPNNLYQKAT